MQACGDVMIGQHGRSVHEAIPHIWGGTPANRRKLRDGGCWNGNIGRCWKQGQTDDDCGMIYKQLLWLEP